MSVKTVKRQERAEFNMTLENIAEWKSEFLNSNSVFVLIHTPLQALKLKLPSTKEGH